MSALTDKQARFSGMVGALLVYADKLEDYRVRLDWAYRSPEANAGVNGHPRSLHIRRLAIDLVLDKRTAAGRWQYQSHTAAYEPLGEFWESLGGAWGGRFGDGGHFSLEHGGVK